LKRIFALLFIVFLGVSCAFASQTLTLQAGISLDKVPKEFYGTWRVSSDLISTNNEEIFKKNSVDLWNLSRLGSVITLDNPFSGAKASITLDGVDNRVIKFRKTGKYDTKKLTDSVELTLGKETFEGTNSLKLDTISEVDGHVLKSEWARYRLSGEKISGASIKE